MKYETRIKKSIDRLSEEQLLHELLLVRGIENPYEFLNLTEDVIHDPQLLVNMQQGVNMLYHWVTQDKAHIHLLMDTDCDGLTSSAFIYLWLQRNFPNCTLTVDVNEGKRHGLNEDIFLRIPEGVNLMICPDSSSDDIEWHNKLDEVGIDLLILDHHEFNTEVETPACIINNQDGQYPNKAFSAPGVVYKFLDEFEYQHFEDMGRQPNCHEYLDILAVGVVADLCDVRDYETRFLVFKGLERLKQTNNELLKAILLSQEQRIKGDINIETIGWNIAPIINAIFRQGTVEDKLLLFRAIVNEHETMTYIPKKATKNNPNKEPIKESLQDHVIRIANSLKAAQDRASKKEVELFKGEIEQNGFNQNPVIILDVTDKIEAGHTGLVANKLTQQYQRPVLLVNGRGGSFRNYDKFPIEDLSSWLMQSELVICKGHSNAGGLDIEKENIELLQNWCKEQLKDHDLTPIYHADLEIPIAKLKNRHINKVGALRDNWGGKNMSKPSFVITGIEIDSADIQRLGKTGTMVKFTTNINGEVITFIRPFTSKEVYQEMTCENVETGRKGINRSGSAGNKKISLTILGEFEVEEFNGKQYPQVTIKHFESKPVVQSSGRRQRKFT